MLPSIVMSRIGTFENENIPSLAIRSNFFQCITRFSLDSCKTVIFYTYLFEAEPSTNTSQERVFLLQQEHIVYHFLFHHTKIAAVELDFCITDVFQHFIKYRITDFFDKRLLSFLPDTVSHIVARIEIGKESGKQARWVLQIIVNDCYIVAGYSK